MRHAIQELHHLIFFYMKPHLSRQRADYNYFAMLEYENLLIKYAQKIRSQSHFEKILERQDMTFDYKPFKIDRLSPEKALIIYRNLADKYGDSKEPSSEGQGWHENQKRLFVWFMVIYAYYLEKEEGSLPTLAHYRQRINFDHISHIFFGKPPTFLEFQFLNLFKVTDKISWTQREDKLLTDAIEICPGGSWTEVSMEVFKASGKERFISSKNCRERWQNHLDRSKVKGNWTCEEDRKIIQFVAEYGKKWSKMRGVLNNKRTEHMIKNRYHSLITKNKTHRYEKEQQTAKRLLEQFQAKDRLEVTERMAEQPEEALQVSVKQVDFHEQLKEENISSESEEKQIPFISAPQKDDIPVKEEPTPNKPINKPINQPTPTPIIQSSKPKMQDLSQQNEPRQLYPFQNYGQFNQYNNSHYDQFFEYQNAHYMMLCQQYNIYANSNAPTNDAYTDGQNPPNHPAPLPPQ